MADDIESQYASDPDYLRVLRNFDRFVGLHADEAERLAIALNVRLDVRASNSWDFGKSISGRVIVDVEDGVVIRANPG